MKLLFDENLSHKLGVRLAELYPESAHVVEFGLLESADREIWEFAKAGDFVIVSTDSDFYELATTIGPPPKVVWLRRWTHPTRDTERVLAATRFASRSSQPIRNWACWCWIGTDASWDGSSRGASRLVGRNLPERRLKGVTSTGLFSLPRYATPGGGHR